MNQAQPDIDSIFCTAIELASADARAAFLDQASAGDAELKGRVEKLLNAHFRVGSFLESPAVARTVDMPPVHESPGTIIGPYKLLEQIGEGGMGTVFMAEQQKPVRRMVALKIVKPGMDTKQVIAR